MATTKARIIKLGNGSTTYIPITSTNASQHYDGSSYVVLESYLGGLSNRIKTNADNISTLAGAALQAKANLDDLNAQVANYNATYIKAGASANQISYNLPNGTYGLITVDNVANATTATNLKNAPSLSKTAASGNNTDSFNVTAGGKTGTTAVTLSKASNTTYGVVKVDNAVSDSSENPVQNKVIKKYADDTFLTKTEFESFSASGMHYKGDTATVPSSPTSGDVYHVTKEITSGLGTGVTAEVGDFITYYKPEGGTGSWSVWDKNVDKAIYAGNNTLTTGQMLVTDGTDGKVKSQAIPTVSVSGSGTGNVVKTISNDDHAISYTVGYAVDTLEKASGSDNSGVLTNITRTNNKLTVTYTDASSSFSGGSTLKTVTGYTQNASGKITNVTFGDIPIMVGTTNGGNAGTKGLVPAPAAGDVTATVVKVLGADGNWKTISATTPKLEHDVTTNLKYSVGGEIELGDIFGNFNDGPSIVTVADHAAGSAVTVSVS